MPSATVQAAQRRLPAWARRFLRASRRGLSWAVVRPESERLHAFLTAQMMESHEFTARALADLLVAAERSAVGAKSTTRSLEVAYTHRALAALPAGSAILEMVSGGEAVTPTLAALGYRVTVISRDPQFAPPDVEVVVGPMAESKLTSSAFAAIVAIGLSRASGVDPDVRRLASPGGLLVLSISTEGNGHPPLDLDGWRILNTIRPEGEAIELLTAQLL